ncbi:hypothetical protein P8C59_006886 [Phyllachora maydis]|uniref:protein O-GlcNAc transferase n=1 Tax=Phyllachora maydis TaxID=1825666 RepID=A0AAD9I7R3_9PEZI|nr:hypothetical protein P8C59_006886 [Phyllachora maydis]
MIPLLQMHPVVQNRRHFDFHRQSRHLSHDYPALHHQPGHAPWPSDSYCDSNSTPRAFSLRGPHGAPSLHRNSSSFSGANAIAPEHSAENSLRRKTPSGTIDNGYDGSHLASGPPPLKHVAMPAALTRMFPDALEWFKRILGLEESHVEAMSNIAATLYCLNRHDEAEKHWWRAVQIRPSYLEAAEHLANMLYALKDVNRASEAFEEAVLISTGKSVRDIWSLIRTIQQVLAPNNADAIGRSSQQAAALTTLLLPPERAKNTAQLVFASNGGQLPGLTHVPEGGHRKSAISTTSNSLLSLAKIFQDAMSSGGSDSGTMQRPAGVGDVLALYYLSLSLQESPSTANNMGILLASVPQCVPAPSLASVPETFGSNIPGIVPGSGLALALAYYHYGLSLDPKHVHLHTNLGSLLKDIGQLDLAISMYEKAVACDGTFDIALTNLANAVKDRGRVNDAIIYYKRAVASNPEFAEAVCGLLTALNSVCDWRGRGGVLLEDGNLDRWHVDDEGMLQDARARGSGSGLMQRVVGIVNRQLRQAAGWGRDLLSEQAIQQLAKQLRDAGSRVTDPGLDLEGELRKWAGRPWEGSRKRVKAFCYATTASDRSVHRQQIEREAPVFRDVSSWSSDKLVDQIVADGIHILVNLNGYTRGARNEVFAARPAPIQMSFMGFAGTLGAEWCDYLLADTMAVPPATLRPYRSNLNLTDVFQDEDGAENRNWVYSENIIYCRDTFFCCDHAQSADETDERGMTWEEEQSRRWKMRKELFPKISDDTIILGNFNQLYKIEPTTFRTWLRILSELKNAVLWLLRFPELGETNLRRTATLWAGEEVANRLVFTDVAPKQQHIARARVCDLFLDTPECNAHTTAADVLWSSTPLLTLPRYEYKMCSRMAASILRGALPRGSEGECAAAQLIAKDDAEYQQFAVRLGGSLTYRIGGGGYGEGRGPLAELRKLLWQNKRSCALFDTRRWVRDLEEAYEEAWSRWVAGKSGDIYL